MVISNGASSRDIETPTRSQKREAREVYKPRSDGQEVYKAASGGQLIYQLQELKEGCLQPGTVFFFQ